MTSQQQNYIRYGSAESEPEGLRDFMDAAIEASFENEEEEEDITVVDKTCICKNNVNKRWTSEGCDVVCDDCQLGGKNDTWLRICYNCGQNPLKGFSGSGRVKCSWRWIGEDCDDCSWICDKCEKEEEEVPETEVEPPLMVWDGNVKQTIVEVKCGSCKTVYKDRQGHNDCVSAYPYEYPKKGFYWMENKECYKNV